MTLFSKIVTNLENIRITKLIEYKNAGEFKLSDTPE